MTYKIISSNSKGNCIIINNCIALDMGVSWERIQRFASQLKVVFISHEHQDHLRKSTVNRLAYQYPNIKFIVAPELVDNLLDLKVWKKNICLLYPDRWYDMKMFKVKIQELIHDVPNSCIHLDLDGEKIIYATDTNEINHIEAKNYNYYFIESNYDTDEELEKVILEKEKRGEYCYEKRVLYSHLSQLKALNWLDINNKNNGEVIFIHQSRRLNNIKNSNIT